MVLRRSEAARRARRPSDGETSVRLVRAPGIGQLDNSRLAGIRCVGHNEVDVGVRFDLERAKPNVQPIGRELSALAFGALKAFRATRPGWLLPESSLGR
jgi:hypothetical protein